MTETRIVPVTLAIDTEGVPKTARTGVRSSPYLLSRDSASSKVIFTARESRHGTLMKPSSAAALSPWPSVRVEWLRAALDNLNAVAGYISRDNPVAAARTVAAIVNADENLKRFLASGRPGRVSGTRELVVSGTPYIVPYRVRGDVVQLIRVFHAARK